MIKQMQAEAEQRRAAEVAALRSSIVSAVAAAMTDAAPAIGAAIRPPLPPPVDQASLQAALATTLPQIVEQSLSTTFLPLLATSLAASLTGPIAATVEMAIERGIATKIPSAVDSTLRATVGPAAEESLRTAFSQMLIPAYERSTKAMFEQIHATFTSGTTDITEAVSNQVRSSLTPLAAVEQRLANLVTETQASIGASLADAAAATSAASAAAASLANAATLPPHTNPSRPATSSAARSVFDSPGNLGGQNGAPPSTPTRPGAVPTHTIAGGDAAAMLQHFKRTMELQDLLAKGEHERAFASALQAQSPELLIWLCNKADPATLLYPRVGAPPSQVILTSLAQQLAANVGTDTALKLRWLQAILPRIDPRDRLIAANIKRLLDQISANLQACTEVLGNAGHPSHASLLAVSAVVSQLQAMVR